MLAKLTSDILLNSWKSKAIYQKRKNYIHHPESQKAIRQNFLIYNFEFYSSEIFFKTLSKISIFLPVAFESIRLEQTFLHPKKRYSLNKLQYSNRR